jgi:hypothetical protein
MLRVLLFPVLVFIASFILIRTFKYLTKKDIINTAIIITSVLIALITTICISLIVTFF